MPKMNRIPAGYRVTSVSCENDGDHYRTVVQEGLSEQKAKLIGEIAGIMLKNESGLENNYEPEQNEIETGHKVFIPIFEKYMDLFSGKEMEEFKKDFGNISSFISTNLTGYSVEGYALRSLDSVKIEYFPEEILIEDVTEKFVK